MSDISSCSSSSSNKRRLNYIDNTIEYLTQDLNTLNDFVYKTEYECSVMTVKMKRERIKVLSAAAKSQIIIAKMDMLIAESDLLTDVERLRKVKRRKFDRYEGGSRVYTPSPRRLTPPLTTNTVSVQTTETLIDKKQKSKRSSSRKKSPVDISSDETVIIPSTHASSASLLEASQKSATIFSPGLFSNTPANKSDSEISLSSSIKAEFNEPYIKTQTQEPVKKSPAKKHKSEKSKSKHVSKSPHRSHTHSPAATPITVADNKKIANTAPNHSDSSSQAVNSPKNGRAGDKKTMAPATFIPGRHNLGALTTQPSSFTMSPYLYVSPATQANSPAFNFYGTKQ